MPLMSWHWAWVILTVTFFDLFVNYSIRLGYSLVIPEMIRDLSLSRTAAATIYNAYFLVYIAVSPLSGFFCDRFGARRVITVCLLILGAGTLLMGRAQDLASASLAFAVAGLGASGMWAPCVTVVQRWFTPQRRGLALGIMTAGSSLGLACVGIFLPFIVANLTWRYSWYFLGFAALIMVAVNALLLRNSPADMKAFPLGGEGGQTLDSPPGPLPKGSLALIFRQQSFWLIGFSYCFIAFALYGVTTFVVDYAQNILGVPQARASQLGTIQGLAQVVGLLVIMPLSDYLGRRTTIVISNSVITAGMVALVVLGNNWPALCVIMGVLAVFYGMTFAIYVATVADYFPRELMGTIIGIWTPFYGSGAIAAHWMSGILRDHTGGYFYPFCICAAAAALSLALIIAVKKPDDPPQRA